jgi:hypothetical protein
MDTCTPNIIGIVFVLGFFLISVGAILRCIIVEFVNKKQLDRWNFIHKEMQEVVLPSDTSCYDIPDIVMWEMGDLFYFEVKGTTNKMLKKRAFKASGSGYFWKALGPSRIVYSNSSIVPSCNHDFKSILKQNPDRIQILDLNCESGFRYSKREIINSSLNTRIKSQKIKSRISDGEFQEILDDARIIAQQHINQAHAIEMVVFDHELESKFKKQRILKKQKN